MRIFNPEMMKLAAVHQMLVSQSSKKANPIEERRISTEMQPQIGGSQKSPILSPQGKAKNNTSKYSPVGLELSSSSAPDMDISLCNSGYLS